MTIQKKISFKDEAEIDLIEITMRKMGIDKEGFSNMARKAIARHLKIKLDPLTRGGIREGGFEYGNQYGIDGMSSRWKRKRK